MFNSDGECANAILRLRGGDSVGRATAENERCTVVERVHARIRRGALLSESESVVGHVRAMQRLPIELL